MSPAVLQADAGGLGGYLVEVGIPAALADPIASAAVFVVVLVAVYAVGALAVVPLVSRLLDRRGVDAHLQKPLRLVAYAFVAFLAIGLAFALAGFGSVFAALATVAAAATLAVGFALQDVIRNFVAGVFIYTDRPFRTGDWIEWEGNSGYVRDISLRVTRVQTFDNEHLTVPNSQLTDGVIKNYDKHGTLRLKFTFRVGFRDDLDRATELILEEAASVEGILDDPEPSVKLIELNDSSFGLQSRIWIEEPGQSDFLGIRGQLVQNVSERFAEEGIRIPYPHRTVEGRLDGPMAGPRA